VDICQGERDRADEQSCRADASPGGDVAEAEPGIAFIGRLPVRGTNDDGAANPATAGPKRNGLSGTGDWRVAMRRESSTAAELKSRSGRLIEATKWKNGLNGYLAASLRADRDVVRSYKSQFYLRRR